MKQSITPYVRASGSGTPVVCLHSSCSSSTQWRALMERLSHRHRVIAVDLHGCGKTDRWPQEVPLHLRDEADLLTPVLRAAGDRFHLVGHSYGAAVALKTALRDPGRLLSLSLFEPSLFSVLMANAPQSAAAREIVAVRNDTVALGEQGYWNASAQRFIDYWTGEGTWEATPEQRRPMLADAMRGMLQQWHAVFCELTPREAFAAIDVPTLSMSGSESPAPARAIASLIESVLPRVCAVRLEGVGHMAPITHPDRVNRIIERFLEVTEPRYTLEGEEAHHAGLH